MTLPNKTNLKRTNIFLLLIVILISAYPLFFHPKGSEFGGADDQGPALIQKEHPAYHVWFQPVWEPPSGEIESLLFALQAGIGAGIIGYVVGYMKGKKQNAQEQPGRTKPDKAVL